MVDPKFNPKLDSTFYFIRKGLYRAIGRHAGSLKGNLLDFGCGSKPYKPLFKVATYTGLDFEKTGHDHSNEQIDVFYDGKTIPFGDGHFDSVLCSEVAEHLFDLPSALKEMNRVLKPGGQLLLTCPFVWGEHEAPFDYARYTQFALQDILGKAGFDIWIYEKEGHFQEAIAQMRVLYWAQVLEPFLAKFSYPGNWIFRSLVFLFNVWAIIKSKLLPRKFDIYLSNIILAKKRV